MLAGLMSRWMMPARVRGVQRVGDLDAHVEQRVEAQRTRGEPILQRRPLQILHDDERSPVLLADVVDRADVRVVQRRRRLRFAREPAQRLGIPRELFGDELERHERRSRVSSALYTTPMPPPPSFSTMR